MHPAAPALAARDIGGDSKDIRLLPMGVMVATLAVAMVLAAAAATLLMQQAPLLGALAAGVLIAASVLWIRFAARTAGRYGALLGIGGIIFSYAFVVTLTLESVDYLVRHRVVTFPVGLIMMLGVVAIALVAPVGIPALVLRRARRRAERTTPGDQSLPDLTPQLLGTCIGVVFIALAFAGWIAILMLAPSGWWRAAASVLLALTLPLVLRPLWIVAYRTALTRWQVPEPVVLREHLSRVSELTRFEFDRVLCLRSFGSGKPCFVILGARQSTLVISEQVVNRLTSEQLLAVLTHEAAHVILNHGTRAMLWGALGGAVVIAINTLGLMTIGPFIPRSLGFVRVLVVILPIGILRQLYDYYVTRRHETEADDFATGLVGAPAMLGALEALGGKGPPAAYVHNRWTTHGTWERRSARIRKKDSEQNIRTQSSA